MGVPRNPEGYNRSRGGAFDELELRDGAPQLCDVVLFHESGDSSAGALE